MSVIYFRYCCTNLIMGDVKQSDRPVPHPDVFWYRLNGIGAQNNAPKKVLLTLLPYLFHVKAKWIKYIKTKIFSIDTNTLPKMHWTLNIFGPSVSTIGGFGVSLNYPILNFKKSVCPKNVWIRHYRCSFLKDNSVLLKYGMYYK